MKCTAFVRICAKIRLMNVVATLLHSRTCRSCIFRQYFHFENGLIWALGSAFAACSVWCISWVNYTCRDLRKFLLNVSSPALQIGLGLCTEDIFHCIIHQTITQNSPCCVSAACCAWETTAFKGQTPLCCFKGSLCEEVMFTDSLFHLTFTFNQSLQNAGFDSMAPELLL